MPAAIRKSRISEGSPNPRGATWDGLGVNFSLFSANATKVELCLFDDAGAHRARADRAARIHQRGLARLSARRAARHDLRLSRARPVRARRNGHRFNPNKLLLDPYAKAYVGALRWDNALFGYTIGARDDDLTFDRRDSARFMPKCRVIDPAFTWGRERRPEVPWDRTIIYETHVRGFTKLHPGGAGRAARHLRRPRPQGGGRLHPLARRHLGRAAADPRLRQRPPSAGQGPDQLLGLQHDRLLRARPALFRRPRLRVRRVQGDGGAPARRRPRGDPRRRLQPHRRRQRARADAVVPRHRQCVLLPAAARISRATTSTTPAPATRSTSAIRACCRWSPTGCATG